MWKVIPFFSSFVLRRTRLKPMDEEPHESILNLIIQRVLCTFLVKMNKGCALSGNVAFTFQITQLMYSTLHNCMYCTLVVERKRKI